jgi:hypothetical protein
MGFFGKLWKGVKNIFSGIGNFVKSAVSGKNWWKTALVGATAYFGGAALGYWNSPVVSSINGAWAGDIQDGGGRKGGWFGEMFGANRDEYGDQVYSKHLKDTDQYDPENYKDAQGNYDDLPPVPSGEGLLEYNPDNYKGTNGKFDDMPPVPSGGGTPANNSVRGAVAPKARVSAANNLTTAGESIVKTGVGRPSPAPKTTVEADGLLASAGKGLRDVSDWTAKHDNLSAVGLSALGGAFEDKQQDAYETAKGTLQGKQEMNRVGSVPKGSRFGSRATASARQTKLSPEAEMEKLRQSMTPEQWAEYVRQMQLGGQQTPSRVV